MTGIVRLASPNDAAALADIYRPAVVDSAVSFELEPPDSAEMARRVDATLQRTPWLVCEATSGVLGYAYASRHRERAAYQWCVEVSAYVRPDVRRAGVATALYTSLVSILARQGFRNAYAAIALPNDASVRLHLSLGFTPIGVYRNIGYKRGAWHDVQWLERELAPHSDNPDPPTPLPILLERANLDEALEAGMSRLDLPAARHRE